ncbi:Hypothetical predicted protein [Mytilus galloprovincialis]|uniref:Uncharacterized protein n=1 Tax=Mytilus galloprovincialis TaxID=29158 RepID=A0A8B6ELI9_MYTGA|nr:Hypothetical predicted protein [Mytilus galloprovincialis]
MEKFMEVEAASINNSDNKSENRQFQDKNGKIINEQEKRRFIERVDERSAKTIVHSIPHHHFRKKSSTTPIRIVFDCSCKPSPINLSLNDCLMDLWPNFNDLTGIFLRFRMHKYAVSTGIEKSLTYYGLDEEDRDVTRFSYA